MWFSLITFASILVGLFSSSIVVAQSSLDRVIKNYNGKEFLDPKTNYQFEWNVNWQQSTLEFTLTVNTPGWVGLGFSKDGTMKDADIVVAGIDPNGQPYIRDMHSDCHRNLNMDNKQNWNLLSSSEGNGRTIVRISRFIDTCDLEDYPITDDLVYILWAYGETDELEYHHQFRGFYKLYLLDPVMHPSVASKLMPRWRASRRVPVLKKRTSYWCSIHKAPRLGRKHHFIQFYPVLENNLAVKHTHHFTLYHCLTPPGVDARTVFENLLEYEGEECYLNDHNLIPWKYCRVIKYVWALGARPLVLPGDVGIPFGEQLDEYYMLEAHYDNPEIINGLQYEAGVEGIFTDRIRPKDGGALMITYDLFGFFMIPPGTQKLQLYTHCPGECTGTSSREGFDIFAIHTHTHVSGKKVKLHHYRKGRELPWIIKDNNYDYNFQNPRPLQVDRTILPGDHLTLDCIYDNTWTNVTTVAAFSSTDEMCLQIIYHTPPSPFYSANSQVPQEHLLNLVGVQNTTWDLPTQERIVTSPASLSGQRLAHVTDDLTHWTKQLRNIIQTETIISPQVVTCPTRIPTTATPKPVTTQIPAVNVPYNRARNCPNERNNIDSYI